MGYEMSKEIDLNMQHITLKEFTEYIKDRIEMEEFASPVLGLGKSGIGKTESMENAIVKPLGINMIQMRLGSYDETDLTGIPMPQMDEKAGKMLTKFADMGKLPQVDRDGEVGILVLDEFTNANPRVRAAALQLTDSSRSVGDYTLPPKWLIVILGNGPGDGGYFNGLEYALMGRADCFRVDVNFADWKDWALRNGVHPIVISFIEEEGGETMLHRMKNMDEAEYEEKDANPRSWVKLSTHLTKKEAKVGKLTERQVKIYAGGAVGSDLAQSFATYYTQQKEIIKAVDIFSGAALKMEMTREKTYSLYVSMLYLANAVVSLLEQNKKKIINEDRLGSTAEASLKNTFKFIKKVADVNAEVAVSALSSIRTASNGLFEILVNSYDFDDIYPEFLEIGLEKMAVLNSKQQIEVELGRAR